MADLDIETEIIAKGLTAPRVTPADIEANIVGEHYFTAADGVAGAIGAKLYRVTDDSAGGEETIKIVCIDPTYPVTGSKTGEEKTVNIIYVDQTLCLLTFCVLILRNGYTVTGESACVSKENFNVEIGRKVARANAVAKIWPLMGYALAEKLAAGA